MADAGTLINRYLLGVAFLLVRQGEFQAKVEKHIEKDFDATKRTFEGLNEDVFEQIVKTLCSAMRVWLFGYRNSRYLAG